MATKRKSSHKTPHTYLHVVLKEDKNEGWEHEEGSLISYCADGTYRGNADSGVILVRLHRRYRNGGKDDGFREVPIDQVQSIAPKFGTEDI